MDLLESVLKTANAEEYIGKFRAEGIDPKSIKLLTDKDLEMMGVDNEEIRASILDQAKNLIISSEKIINTGVDVKYMDLALLHVANQLKLHNANLFCAANRPDIINCNVQLQQATDSLLVSITSLEQELRDLKQKIKSMRPKKEMSRKKKNLLIASIGFVVVNVFFLWKINH